MEIVLDSPLDMHLHLRDGAMLRLVAPLSAGVFAGAVIMPIWCPRRQPGAPAGIPRRRAGGRRSLPFLRRG